MNRQEVLRRIEGTISNMQFDGVTLPVARSKVKLHLEDVVPESIVVMEEDENSTEMSGSLFYGRRSLDEGGVGFTEVKFTFKV